MLYAINCEASSAWVNWEHWVFPTFLSSLSLHSCHSCLDFWEWRDRAFGHWSHWCFSSLLCAKAAMNGWEQLGEEEFWGRQWLGFQENTCGTTSSCLLRGVMENEEEESKGEMRDVLWDNRGHREWEKDLFFFPSLPLKSIFMDPRPEIR